MSGGATPFPTAPNVPLVNQNGFITMPWQSFFTSLFNRTGGSQGGSQVPTGALVAFGGTVAPSGYLLCNGQAVSRSTFQNLFGVIGTTYGAGDGNTTFNVPNLSGAVPLGSSGGIPLGSSGGAAEVTLQVAQLPSHTHGVEDPGHTHVVSDPGHEHSGVITDSGSGLAGSGAGGSSGDTASATTGITNDSSETGITIQDTGGGQPVPTLPPYQAVNWLIKV